MGGFLSRWRRRRQADRAPEGPLKEYLRAPAPRAGTAAGDLSLLAVDFETTGLNPATDRLLTVGFIPVERNEIILSQAGYLIVAQPGEVGQSAVVHGVTDDVLASGVPLEQALAVLLQALTGRVLLAHHAVIEEGFTAAACRQVYGPVPEFTTVDTMTLQAKVLRVDEESAPRGSLRLSQARRHYGLPRYRSHHALTDALACAELYLAQVADLGPGCTLGSLQAPPAGLTPH